MTTEAPLRRLTTLKYASFLCRTSFKFLVSLSASEVVDDVFAVAAWRVVGVNASNADIGWRVTRRWRPRVVVVVVAVVVVSSSSSSGVLIHVVSVVVVVVVVYVVVVIHVVDIFIDEVERHSGRALLLEEELDDRFRPPSDLVPASSHHRAPGANSSMSMHETHEPDEREQHHDGAVDELEVAEVRLQLCTHAVSAFTVFRRGL